MWVAKENILMRIMSPRTKTLVINRGEENRDKSFDAYIQVLKSMNLIMDIKYNVKGKRLISFDNGSEIEFKTGEETRKLYEKKHPVIMIIDDPTLNMEDSGAVQE